MQDTESRERMFTPDVTSWTFLSQVIDTNKSQQAAVSRVIAASIAPREKKPPLKLLLLCVWCQ